MVRKIPPGTECVYCGDPAEDWDHVPPKCLFSKSNRHNLIRVPACIKCNNSFAKDDEYFRQMLSMRDDTGEGPDVTEAREASLRALSRKDQKKLKDATLRNRFLTEAKHGEIYLGLRHGYMVDLHRLNRTVSRAVKGLFAYEFDRMLPDDHVVLSFEGNEIPKGDIGFLAPFSRIARTIVSNGYRAVGKGVFRYGVAHLEGLPDTTIWILQFYGSVFFVALTLPKEMSRPSHSPRLFS